MTDVTVRVLDEDQWQDYRRLRLAALEADPDAFASSLAEEQEFPEERWRDRIRRSRRLVASRDDVDLEGADALVAPPDLEALRNEKRGRGILCLATALVSLGERLEGLPRGGTLQIRTRTSC